MNGEGYKSKQSCLEGIASVKVNVVIDSRYERKDNPGNYTFNLTAANREIIGRSENYSTASARETGIAVVKKDAPGAPIEDLT